MKHLQRRRPTFCAVMTVVMTLTLVSACKRETPPAPQAAPKPPPRTVAQIAAFRVVSVQVGNAIGADKKVVAPGSSFKPTDTIYASVSSDGPSPSVVIAARWTYEDGQLISESSQTIAPTGPTVTEFHISKPDGWPAGKYKVEITANGTPATAAEFAIAG